MTPFIRRLAATLALACGTAVAAPTDDVVRLQQSWAQIKYQVPVTRQEAQFDRLLAESHRRVFNRAQLEESLYGWGEGAESNTIDVHVHHRRKKLGADVVMTIRGVDYRLGDSAA